MQINTTVKSHLPTVRMPIIKKSTNNKRWRECEEKWSFLRRWQECNLVWPLWRTVWVFLKKLKRELPYDPAIPLLALYPDKTITGRYMHPYVHSSAIWNSQDMETPTDRWMGKEDVAHIYKAIKKNPRKEQNNAHCSNMDGSRDYYTQWSQKEKRQIPYDITYMWNLKYYADEPIYETETQRG